MRMNVNTNSQEWLDIKEWAEGRLQELREQNDSNAPERDTAITRGKIEFAKEVLALGEQNPQIEVGDNNYLPD